MIVQTVHGQAFGEGVYTSPCPIYAQLYATPEKWRNRYVQTILMIKQHPDLMKEYSVEGHLTKGLLGRTDLHKLYKGQLKENRFQYCTKSSDPVSIVFGLLIKIHATHPEIGEYAKIAKMLEDIKD